MGSIAERRWITISPNLDTSSANFKRERVFQVIIARTKIYSTKIKTQAALNLRRFYQHDSKRKQIYNRA